LEAETAREPLLGWEPTPPSSHPTNYFVPHFGKDEDNTLTTNNSLDWAEKSLGHKWNYVKSTATPPPKDYAVPNFGVDEDIANTQASIAHQESIHGKWVPVQDDNGVWIVPAAHSNKSYTYAAAQVDSDNLVQLESDPICSSAGCNYASEKGAKTHPMNYFVPHFGRDHDMTGTDVSLDWAEKSLGHKWNWVKPGKKEDSDFRVPDFGLDEDIVGTQSNIAHQEKLHGPWTPKQDDNGVWIVPAAADNKSYSYLDASNVQLDAESDPICSSAGCNHASEKGPAGHPMNYFVPHFGRDQHVNESFSSLDWAEKQLNHKWVVGPKQKPKDPILYIDANPLDHEMQASLKHLKEQEAIHGVWHLPE